MMNQQIAISCLFGRGAATKLSLFYIEIGGSFQMVLVFAVPQDRGIDAVAARQQTQLVQLAHKSRCGESARQIISALHGRIEECYWLAELVIDGERAGYAWTRRIDRKDKTCGASCG